jgi:putative chitinase
MTSERVTNNFHLAEFLVSDTATRLGLDNTPDATAYANLVNILIPSMQAVRDLLGAPVLIKSGYRGRNLNAAVRGSPSSQHCTGNAADFIAPGFGSTRMVCVHLVKHMARLRFDQLIHEGNWVHISFSARQRNEVLTAKFTADGVSYVQGLA